jgi:hypothetical protein
MIDVEHLYLEWRNAVSITLGQEREEFTVRIVEMKAMCDALTEARADAARLRAALAGVEWVAEYTPEGAVIEEWCPECGHRRSLGHTPYCILGDALALYPQATVQTEGQDGEYSR